MLNVKNVIANVLLVGLSSGFVTAHATVTFDEDVTPNVIFGSGNTNGNFTVDRSGAIELGLRAKIPFASTINSNGDGTYSYTLAETDDDNSAATPNRWNFDWTVNIDSNNSSALNLNDYTFELGLDADPSLNTNFLVFDPVTPSASAPFFDHSIGDNSTGNGAGTEAADAPTYMALLNANNVLQQSWRYSFFPLGALSSYDPDVPGTYAVYLLAKDSGGAVMSRVDIQVLIGGAPPVLSSDYSNLCSAIKTQNNKIVTFCL